MIASILFAIVIFAVLVLMIVLIGFALKNIIGMMKEDHILKNTAKWSYEFYKENRWRLDFIQKGLLSKLAEGLYDASAINDIIEKFNALEPKCKYPLTVEMVEFEKRNEEEEKPEKRLRQEKEKFIRRLFE
jgi:hypothetical protein